MKYNGEVFQKQFPLVKWFVYHLTYYRELKRVEGKLTTSPFWAFTIDGHLLQAAIYWCMVFGSKGSNPTHWKNLAICKEDDSELSESFTKAVLSHTDFTETGWAKYWKEMVEFRNRYVVHRDSFQGVVPDFDKALEVAYAYDGWVRATVFPGFWQEPHLKDSAKKVREEIASFIHDFCKPKT